MRQNFYEVNDGHLRLTFDHLSKDELLYMISNPSFLISSLTHGLNFMASKGVI
jgi:hypothetical protein